MPAADRSTETTSSAYIFDNSAPQTPERFGGLDGMFNPSTTRHLGALGLTEGWRCWEVGAGSGAVAAWLSQQVGPDGHVVATDIDVRHAAGVRAANLDVVRHDVVADDPPGRDLDLVHARLVLHHLPGREQALKHMISALKPGGWVVVEDFDRALENLSETTSDEHAQALLLKLRLAQQRRMAARGVDQQFGRNLFGVLQRHGLEAVGAEGRALVSNGGSAWTRVREANIQQSRDELVSSGALTHDEIDEILTILADPSIVLMTPLLMTAWGRTPLTPLADE